MLCIHTHTHTQDRDRLVVAPLNAITLNNHHLERSHSPSVPGRSDVTQLKPTRNRKRAKPTTLTLYQTLSSLYYTLCLRPQMQTHLGKNVAESQDYPATEEPSKNRKITRTHAHSIPQPETVPSYCLCVPLSTPAILFQHTRHHPLLHPPTCHAHNHVERSLDPAENLWQQKQNPAPK